MNKKAGDIMTVGLQLMTPIRPMLAEACKSVSMALGKCPEVSGSRKCFVSQYGMWVLDTFNPLTLYL